MVEVIAKHQNYKEAKKDPTYIQLKNVSRFVMSTKIASNHFLLAYKRRCP